MATQARHTAIPAYRTQTVPEPMWTVKLPTKPIGTYQAFGRFLTRTVIRTLAALTTRAHILTRRQRLSTSLAYIPMPPQRTPTFRRFTQTFRRRTHSERED